MSYLFPKRRRLIWGYGIYAVVVAVATVYGRYHYAIDAVAGATVGLAAYALGRSLTISGQSPMTKAAGDCLPLPNELQPKMGQRSQS
jgi:hypothetical protein